MPANASRQQSRNLWHPKRVIVDDEVMQDSVTQMILANCAPCEVVRVRDTATKADRQILIEALKLPEGTQDEDLAKVGRASMLLCDSEELIQQMAAGPAMERRCFNFLKIMPYTGVCPYDCSYCWFKDPVLIPRVNVRFFERLPSILNRLRNERRTPTLFTFTHYKTDCFTMEHLTGFCRRAADFFDAQTGFAVQFLTKSDLVDCLLYQPIPKKAIVTFSVNPSWIAKHIDIGTPSLEKRLRAAGRLSRVGIPIMLRVDPILRFEGWTTAYDEMVEQIFSEFEPVHVTLGTPRFQNISEFTTVAERVRSKRALDFMQLLANQMTVAKPGQPQEDNSFRSYFKNMSVSYPDVDRIELYRTVASIFRKRRPNLALGLCEEAGPIWEEVGLEWTGDKTRDCSCNFVPRAFGSVFTDEERQRIAKQTEEARELDSQIATGRAAREPILPILGNSKR